MDRNAGLSLLCRVETRFCALPLNNVIELMRPLPTDMVAGAPPFVLGLSIIRGSAVPVVDAGQLLACKPSSPSRFVLLKVGERRVGLAVDEVVGVRAIDGVSLGELPPLLRNADTEAVSAIGMLDAELLMILTAVRIVPEELLTGLEEEARAS